MKIISLNIGSKIDNSQEVINFLEKEDADIICLQEVLDPQEKNVKLMFRSKETIDTRLSQIYPYSFFGSLWASLGYNHRENWFGGVVEQGNYILSKYPIVSGNSVMFHRSFEYISDRSKFRINDHGRAFLQTILDINGTLVQVINLHGVRSKDKEMTERSEKQCADLISLAQQYDNMPTIVCGDFNLLPNTKGIKYVSTYFENLIYTYDIQSTRPSFDDGTDVGDNVVDYFFINELMTCDDFTVPNTSISDHLPLILTCSLST